MENYIEREKQEVKQIKEYIKSLPLKRDKNNNVIVLIKNNNKYEFSPIVNGLSIKFVGKNNTVVLHENSSFINCNLNFGNDNICIIGKTKQCICLTIHCIKSKNTIFKTGHNFVCIGAEFQCRDGKHFLLGDNVLLSYGISFWNGDAHTIFNEHGEIINFSKSVIVGNNVWIGHRAEILKGSMLNDNTVVGACSVVNKIFNEQHIVISGNPAQIIRHGITWSHLSPQEVLLSK